MSDLQPLSFLTIVLVRTKFSENIGSVARACANLGCPNLYLVSPENFILERALPLATPKGKQVLEKIKIFPSLTEAIADFHGVFATTARLGGWRKSVLLPEECAREIHDIVELRGKVAIVFGPEDKGLTNEEIKLCGQLVSIPTCPDAWSLNLAQAVLILLYECFKLFSQRKLRPIHDKQTTLITSQDLQRLFINLQKVLLKIDFLHLDNNPDYFMLPLKRFFYRVRLRKNEYNLFMGICRQIEWICSKKNKN
ncbi:MAG: RNA methyltransferase [Desulfonauticus sp.]|nr:RNA methyltransferase [Desulfonauticus sp.]